MFRSLCRQLCYFSRDTDLTFTILALKLNPSLKYISTTTTITNSTDRHSFTVSYLINSCGLSEQAAISASKRVHFVNSIKPDLVISLFRDYGFSNAQITKIIRVHPNLLLCDTDKTLKPKLEFFRSAGVSSLDLAQIIFRDPGTLLRSLENQIIPSFEFLRGLVETNEDVIKVFKNFPRNSMWAIRNYMVPNIAALQHHGVPEALISIMMVHPSKLLRRPERFNEIVKEVKEMGFDPLEASFLSAVRVIAGLSKSTWKAKLDILRKWGWTEDEILSAFKRQPLYMMLSEKKIVGTMDFLINTMGLKPSVIAKCPSVLTYSLDKTIIPRCSVIQALLSNGLIEKDFNLATLVISSEESFLKRYVTKYKVQAPQLLMVYQGQIDWRKCTN
ncbi:transcription termination factor MTERF5, chloroplastic-like [Macadamia integrifolia]|uniref:transcription termination factor MTERF5, chloroplastic-like n=1 Tax=Macadamia integrifolia TaxID=60698 RepID=UPI001C4FEC9D|nr:transcription termination factor MTERF5, chloroplastic-like [Macadamia integrifolia]